MIKLSWNGLEKEFFNNTSGIFANYKEHEKSCLRSHKTEKILSYPYKKLAVKRQVSGALKVYFLQTK